MSAMSNFRINNYRNTDRASKLDLPTGFEANKFFINATVLDAVFPLLSCVYCQKKLTAETGSLDRRDNNLGHDATNVLVSCADCNKCRGILSAEKFLHVQRLAIMLDDPACLQQKLSTVKEKLVASEKELVPVIQILKKNHQKVLDNYVIKQKRTFFFQARYGLRVLFREAIDEDHDKSFVDKAADKLLKSKLMLNIVCSFELTSTFVRALKVNEELQDDLHKYLHWMNKNDFKKIIMTYCAKVTDKKEKVEKPKKARGRPKSIVDVAKMSLKKSATDEVEESDEEEKDGVDEDEEKEDDEDVLDSDSEQYEGDPFVN